MPSTWFEGILVYLPYRLQNDVEYYDEFFHMRKMEEVCNLNMAEEFNPPWINVLDKSIME